MNKADNRKKRILETEYSYWHLIWANSVISRGPVNMRARRKMEQKSAELDTLLREVG